MDPESIKAYLKEERNEIDITIHQLKQIFDEVSEELEVKELYPDHPKMKAFSKAVLAKIEKK